MADPRLTIAAVAALLLAAVIGIVALSAGGASPTQAPPPAGCLERWNSDPRALVYGRHNYAEHLYVSAQVRLLSTKGQQERRKRGGRCAVIFGAPGLDPEPFAAGKRYSDHRWAPLSKLPGIPDVRLAELQVEALSAANVGLRPDGTLRAF